MTTKTVRVTIDRMMCGRSCGERGVTCYKFRNTNQVGGVSLEAVMGEEFPDGTVLEVSVRVVKRTRYWRKNPWLRGERAS